MKFSALILVLPLFLTLSCGDDVQNIESPPEVVTVERPIIAPKALVKTVREITLSDEVLLPKFTDRLETTLGETKLRLKYAILPENRIISKGEVLKIFKESFSLSDFGPKTTYLATFKQSSLQLKSLSITIPLEVVRKAEFEELLEETLKNSKF
ncbi:MAG: hypothetical protein HN509_03000 [Halobacteriovoraceae bacterium]|jgi:hypothetical protein|nr:hypothetical protein [Halobacteriovoraceae bacterium]MBT5095174.1 hypothetical protein [Halobacteriovoraceae bacterium]